MCVVSMVYDYYRPLIPDTDRWTRTLPIPGTIQPLGPLQPPGDLEEMIKNINDFWKAVEAAKAVDKLTGQPDCEDPEKMKLEARVTELEAIIAEMRKPKKKRKKKRKS